MWIIQVKTDNGWVDSWKSIKYKTEQEAILTIKNTVEECWQSFFRVTYV